MIATVKDKWFDIISQVREESEMLDVSFETWILPLIPDYFDRGSSNEYRLHIVVPEQQFVSFVTKRYAPFFCVAVAENTGIRCSVIFETKTQAPIREMKKNIPPPISEMEEKLKLANLNSRYTFDTFVVGSSNKLAHAAALAVAEAPGAVYNPLFLYGGVGLGKTHLMHSIAQFMIKRNPNVKVLYVTSETFTNDLIDAIRNRNNISTTDFRNKYRNIDALLIDDIQFIIGKESTQEEFFHTFNTLYESKKQIIISSDKPPKEFETLEERLRSRFECGLQADIQSPDYETRMAILRKKEEIDGMNVDDSVIKYIATNIKSNIRELEGALTKIVAYGKLNGIDVTVEVAQAVLKDMITPDAPVKITPERIIQVVAEHYSLQASDLTGQKRNKEIAYPRQIAMYLCQNMTDVPLIQIGKSLGGRDHTTIIHGSKKISTDMQSNIELRELIELIKKKISPH